MMTLEVDNIRQFAALDPVTRSTVLHHGVLLVAWLGTIYLVTLDDLKIEAALANLRAIDDEVKQSA